MVCLSSAIVVLGYYKRYLDNNRILEK